MRITAVEVFGVECDLPAPLVIGGGRIFQPWGIRAGLPVRRPYAASGPTTCPSPSKTTRHDPPRSERVAASM